VVLSGVCLAACGTTGSKSSGRREESPCAYVTKLDEIADGVGRADVHDPDEFKKTLDDAVQDYVTNVQSLRAVAPRELGASLDRIESDIRQYRFVAARTDGADLDAYAARLCGGVAHTSTTAGGPATTRSVPATTGSVPATTGSVPATTGSVPASTSASSTTVVIAPGSPSGG
jgi:hypothetical protein